MSYILSAYSMYIHSVHAEYTNQYTFRRVDFMESIKEKVDSEVYNKFIECIDKYQK